MIINDIVGRKSVQKEFEQLKEERVEWLAFPLVPFHYAMVRARLFASEVSEREAHLIFVKALIDCNDVWGPKTVTEEMKKAGFKHDPAWRYYLEEYKGERTPPILNIRAWRALNKRVSQLGKVDTSNQKNTWLTVMRNTYPKLGLEESSVTRLVKGTWKMWFLIVRVDDLENMIQDTFHATPEKVWRANCRYCKTYFAKVAAFAQRTKGKSFSESMRKATETLSAKAKGELP